MPSEYSHDCVDGAMKLVILFPFDERDDKEILFFKDTPGRIIIL